MQTFLPYPSFSRSAAVLDMKRLGKQRVEAKQVLQAILDVDKLGQAPNTGQAFVNHPIMHQWAPYPEALLSYTWYICREWRDRGYRDGIMPWLFQVAKLRELRMMHERALDRDSVRRPWWLGAPRVHVYHRANLIVKMPSHYSQFQWTIPDRLASGFGYAWPLTEPNTWKVIRRDNR
jgi:hypothetical protein